MERLHYYKYRLHIRPLTVESDHVFRASKLFQQYIVDALPQEYLQSLETAGLPLSQLRVKTGAPVMLLRNLYPKEGLCNGTRLTI